MQRGFRENAWDMEKLLELALIRVSLTLARAVPDPKSTLVLSQYFPSTFSVLSQYFPSTFPVPPRVRSNSKSQRMRAAPSPLGPTH